MRRFASLLCFVLIHSALNFLNAQKIVDVGINEELAIQHTENYVFRIYAEKTFMESIKQQQKDYRRILLKSAVVDKMKKDMYNAVYKVDNEIKNGKQVKYFLEILDEIKKNSDELYAIAYKNPKYYEVFSKVYDKVIDVRENIYKDTEPIFTTTKGLHIDNYDRVELIAKMTQKAKKLNEEILSINLFLQTSKMIDDVENARPLENYVNRDREIMESVMAEYKDKF